MSVRVQDKLHFSIINWDICNFLNGPFSSNVPFESPEFVTHFETPIRWRLSITRRRLEDEHNYTALSVKRSPSCTGRTCATVKLKMMVVDKLNKIWWEKRREFHFMVNSTFTFRYGPMFDNLMETYGNIISPDGTLLIRCEMLDATVSYVDTEVDEDLMALSRDLETFNIRNIMTNFNLNCHGEELGVHLAIVKARSPMIPHYLLEADEDDYNHLDISQYAFPRLIKRLISYWYSGDFKPLLRNASFSTYGFLRSIDQKELLNYFEPETIQMSTTFEVCSTTVVWMIEGYNNVEKDNIIESPEFQQELPSGVTTLRFTFFPKGTPENPDFISFFVTMIEGSTGAPMHLEMSLMENGTEYHQSRSTISWMKTDGKFGFYQYMTQCDFKKIRSRLLRNNTLSIRCTIKFATGKWDENMDLICNSGITALRPGNCYKILQNDLERLYTSEDVSDVTLIVGDRKFSVHKSVLAARSSYFETMFKNYLTGGEGAVVPLHGIDSENLDMILRYIYYAKPIVLNLDLALKLYPYVQRYSISRLSKLCSDVLKENLTLDNIFPIIETADMYSDNSLLLSSRNFVIDNWKDVKNSENWKQFQKENKELAKKFLSHLNDPLRELKPDSDCATF